MALVVGCIVFLIGGVLQTACFDSLPQFYVGRLIAGMGVGIMSMVCPTYASEIAPKEIRGKITGLFQIVVVTGVAVSFWINYGVTFMPDTAMQWRVPIGFQIVPVGLMMLLLPFLKESPRWLATKHRDEEGLRNLAWIRKVPMDDQNLTLEFAEIQAAIREEEENIKGATWREIFVKGNPVRFIMAFVMFTLQQWSGQNSISYYAPIIFETIGFKGSNVSLLASGIYGIVKIVATGLFIAFGVERFGRKKPLLVGVFMMSACLWIIGAVFNTHNPQVFDNVKGVWVTPKDGKTSPASMAMAAMIYIYVIPYCFSVGPLPWVICSEIFNNRTRHYGLMTAAAAQWLWNFAVSMATPHMVDALPQGGLFFFFACINIISVILTWIYVPETQGVSLEAMDIIFGSTTAEQREIDIARRAKDLQVEHIEKDVGENSLHEERRSRDQMV